MYQLQCMILRPGGIVPAKAHPEDAAFDLYTPENFYLTRGDVKRVPLAIALAVPPNTLGRVLERSSMGAQGIHVLGGVIDPGYRGELIVLLQWLPTRQGQEVLMFKAGDKVAQLALIQLHACVSCVSVEQLSEGDGLRGEGGFGSTGR